MHEMHWTWAELQATPRYVQQFTWDLINARRAAEKQAADNAREEARRAH